MRRFFATCVLLVFASPLLGDDHPVFKVPSVSTFSIVAIDPANGDMGVAVASRYFSVGSVVPWALAGVGAVATQANVNVGYGPKGIDLLREGLPAKQVLERLLAEDTFEGKDGRQVAIVDALHGLHTFSKLGSSSLLGGDASDEFIIKSSDHFFGEVDLHRTIPLFQLCVLELALWRMPGRREPGVEGGNINEL